MEPKAPERIVLQFCKACGHQLDDTKYLCSFSCKQDASRHEGQIIEVIYVKEKVKA